MTSGLLLDTHAWVWLRAGKLKAAPSVVQHLRDAADADRWFISDFTFAEMAQAAGRNRLEFDKPLLQWLREALRYPGPQVLPVTPEIAQALLQLPPYFHGDPGDRILAATAIVHDLTVCTHDKAMLRYAKQGLFRALKVSEKKEAAVGAKTKK